MLPLRLILNLQHPSTNTTAGNPQLDPTADPNPELGLQIIDESRIQRAPIHVAIAATAAFLDAFLSIILGMLVLGEASHPDSIDIGVGATVGGGVRFFLAILVARKFLVALYVLAGLAGLNTLVTLMFGSVLAVSQIIGIGSLVLLFCVQGVLLLCLCLGFGGIRTLRQIDSAHAGRQNSKKVVPHWLEPYHEGEKPRPEWDRTDF